MELTNQIILGAGLLVTLSIVASLLSARVGMPMLLAFLLLGMLLGEDGPGGIYFDDIQTAHLIGSLALAVILFDGGLRTDARTFRVGLRPALSLATVGVVITAAITGAAATWLLEVHWLQGLLIGAIVASTDAAAVFSLLHAHGLELKQRVGATLEIESGSNDPMAIFLTVALVELLAAGKQQLDVSLLINFVQQIGLGCLLGWAGGRVLVWVVNQLQLAPGLYPLLALAGGLMIFGATAVAGGSGFLAIYLAGLILGNRPLQAAQNIRRFHDGMAWLSQIGMFLMLGLLVTPSEVLPVAPQALLVAGVLIFVARPLAVALGLLPFRFTWREQLFVAWVGLRGAVPIILALFPLLAGLDEAATFFNIAFFVVLVSLVLQGWTVAPAARWLGLEVPPRAHVLQRVELDLPGQLEYEMVGYRIAADSPAVAAPISRLPLPEQVRLVAVIRGDHVLGGRMSERQLQPGDNVYLISPGRSLEALDRIFVASHAPERLEDRRFFGEFVLNADAKLSEVAAVYGTVPPDGAQDRTIGAYLQQAFVRPVVGDRVHVGSLELVVREMEGERIIQVGLKLTQWKA